MKIAYAFFWLLLLGSAYSAPVLKGNSGSAGRDKPAEAKSVIEKKALGLIEKAVGEAGELKLVENRIHVQGVAASLLWPRDAEAALDLFKQASGGVAQLIADLDPAEPQYPTRLQSISELRMELIAVAAPHDPQAALDFVRATRQPSPH